MDTLVMGQESDAKNVHSLRTHLSNVKNRSGICQYKKSFWKQQVTVEGLYSEVIALNRHRRIDEELAGKI